MILEHVKSNLERLSPLTKTSHSLSFRDIREELPVSLQRILISVNSNLILISFFIVYTGLD